MHTKKYIFSFLAVFLLLISSTETLVYANPFYSDEVLSNSSTSENQDEILLEKFQLLVEDLFSKRNSSILSRDSEGLKKFYDLNKKVGLWAYENEIKKINYFSNWSEKQGANFIDITSIVKVTKAVEKEKDLFGVICYGSTKFTYSYIDQPDISNSFKLGTYHYLNLKKVDDNYIITKEWYTDPLADSLDIKNMNSDKVRDYILCRTAPEYTPDDRTQKAIDYAHMYCGISDNEEFLFKYNKDYKDFNPEGGDCANFASQILHEGGGFKKNNTWAYSNGSASKAWVNAQGFKNYMINSGRGCCIAKGSYEETYKASFNLRPGDIVAYEKKGRICHVSTVTGLDSKGYPLVTCHNSDRLLVPYDLGWSNSNITFHFIDIYY